MHHRLIAGIGFCALLGAAFLFRDDALSRSLASAMEEAPPSGPVAVAKVAADGPSTEGDVADNPAMPYHAFTPALVCESCLSTPVRSLTDRPDDSGGPQVHVIYVLPSDQPDQQLDTNGTIANSVAAWQTWLAGQTDGRTLRVDSYMGVADISFLRLSKTDAEMAALGRTGIMAPVRDAIVDAGLYQNGKIYVGYYGGHSPASEPACGASDAELVGIAFLGDASGCGGQVGLSATVVGRMDLTPLHETVHTLGFVPSCAPHSAAEHVTDFTNDLMYTDPVTQTGRDAKGPWVLDFGRDDYYGHSLPGCPDLAASAWFRDSTAPIPQATASNFQFYQLKSSPYACDLTKPVPDNAASTTGLCIRFDISYLFGTHDVRYVLVHEGGASVESRVTRTFTNYRSAPGWLMYIPSVVPGRYRFEYYVDGALAGSSQTIDVR